MREKAEAEGEKKRKENVENDREYTVSTGVRIGGKFCNCLAKRPARFVNR